MRLALVMVTDLVAAVQGVFFTLLQSKLLKVTAIQ